MGTEKLKRIEFERVPLCGKWKAVLGNVPYYFVCVIYGKSGHGKTECYIHLAKELALQPRMKVKVLLYEQGFGADIQDAINRNGLEGLPIEWCDPWDKPDDVSLFDDLVKEIGGHKSAKVWIIDSYDATRFNEEQILELQKLCEKRQKILIWISHAKGNVPDKAVAKKIEYYGHVGILVKHYIATPQKNRFSGFEPYVIWEQKARELNPLFFETHDKAAIADTPKPKKRKIKN